MTFDKRNFECICLFGFNFSYSTHMLVFSKLSADTLSSYFSLLIRLFILITILTAFISLLLY